MSGCAPYIDGTTPGGGGGGGGGEQEVIASMDWRTLGSFDFAAAGNGSYNVGGVTIHASQMPRASAATIGPSGMRIVANDGASFTFGGTAPACPNLFVLLDEFLPFEGSGAPHEAFGRRSQPWTFWTMFSEIELPSNLNGAGVQVANSGSTAAWTAADLAGGFQRRTSPPSPFEGNPSTFITRGSGTVLPSHWFGQSAWRVIALRCHGREGSWSAYGGPPDAWLDMSKMFQIGNASSAGTSAASGNQEIRQPYTGRFRFGVPTNNSSGAPSATITETVITVGG